MAVDILLLTLLALAALWWCISVGLTLTLELLDRAVECCRDELAVERIRHQAGAHQRRLDTLRRRQRGWWLVDLDGRRRWLEQDQLEGFARSCWLALELQAPCSMGELRRHWRRGSLRWHPDQGGDHESWLRRLRAYEALRQLGRDAGTGPQLTARPPTLLATHPRARRWSHTWPRRRRR